METKHCKICGLPFTGNPFIYCSHCMKLYEAIRTFNKEHPTHYVKYEVLGDIVTKSNGG